MEEDERGKLFVGGLSWETTQENLQRFFSRYGEIVDCVVMKNNETGRSRGFGFVTFADPSNLNIVLQNGPHCLDGRTIDPKPCNPRTLQKPRKGGGFKIFLGGLPSNITETDLRHFFNRYGKVTEVVIMYDQEKKKSRGFGFLSFEDEGSVDSVTHERYINLNGKQVEIKKAEPRDGGGGYNKMGDSSQWGHHQGQPMGMVQGPNGQMGGPPMNMHAPNMMPGYQNWGTSPQQQGYGYSGNSAPNSYQGWGGPPPQGVPQWNNYGNPPPAQGYNAYDMYNSSSAPNASSGANWSSWNIPSNNGGSATASGPDMYNRSQTWTGNQSAGAPGMPRGGPGNSASKSGSEYEYSGYGSGYDYDYTNYGKDQGSASSFAVPRSYGETSAPAQYPPSQAV
ncbi:hypothetical protein HA402_014751 [Bradysia odoriphaga]|nr:hypothetical protein HA402_014751 [Bradysia odoriphaga]